MAYGTKARRAGLLGGSALALIAALSGGRAASALDECGTANPGDTVTCTPAGNDFPNGIQYKVDDLTIVVQDGVVIDTTTNAGEPGGVVSGGNGNYGFLTIKAGTSGGSGVTITTDQLDADGIRAESKDGGITIDANADISTGAIYSAGITAISTSKIGVISVTSIGDIETDGVKSYGIQALGIAGVSVVSIGDVATGGVDATGIEAVSADNAASIFTIGDIATSGAGAHAIHVTGESVASINTAGNITTSGAGAIALYAESDQGIAFISSKGQITTSGKYADGVALVATNAADIETIISGGVSTTGYGARAIFASADTGDILIRAYAELSTTGDQANVISAFTDGAVTVRNNGIILSKGAGSDGIVVEAGKNVTVISYGSITTLGAGDGIDVSSYAGDIDIRSTGDILTKGTESTGIWADATNGKIEIVSFGNITTSGYDSAAIYADGEKSVRAVSFGAIATSGKFSTGIFVESDDEAAEVFASGSISTTGESANGILAQGQTGVGVDSNADITTSGQGSSGIEAYSVKDDVSITSSGNISTAADNADGLSGFAKDGAVFITSVGSIATKGDGSDGIVANAGGEGVILKNTGNITTAGEYAVGIFASSKMDSVTITSSGTIVTGGDGSDGIAGYGSYVEIVHVGNVATAGENAEAIRAVAGSDSVNVELTGTAITKGEDAVGIFARSTDAGVRITSIGDVLTFGKSANGIDAASKDIAEIKANSVIATGRYSSGIFVYSQTENRVTVSGTVLGGWDGGTGVFLDQSKASSLTIDSGGAVGALSDFAIDQDDDKLGLFNNGAIIGSFFFDDGDDQLFNFESGAVHLRQFADTNGDLTRDKEGVAIGNFDADLDSFDNRGVLRLATVSGATAWDTTGQILHPGGGNSDITQEGVEQGFLLGLETFAHSGLITLSDGVAGDLLVITDQADGKTKGANVFTSNGGSLALDVVLDDGASKQSDVLILDKAETGTGATRVFVSNAGGTGGQTTGDGILVINVRDKSDADAFVSGGPAVAGAYQYDLFYQNQAKTDENWYLRSSFFEGSLEYPAIASGALTTWYADLGGQHDRLGQRRAQVAEAQTASLNTATDMADSSTVRMDSGGDGGWFRVSGSDMDIEQKGPADFDLNTTRAEAGFDIGLNNLFGAEDWLVLGAMAGYGWSSLGFDSGSAVDFDIATVGAYATYFRGPYYLDALVKFDWLDGTLNSDTVSEDGDVELPVFGFSLETGYRFDVTAGGLYVQPQAQLSYAHSGSDSLKDDSGSKIELEDADSLRGRLGARLGQELTSDSGAARGNFYLEASVNQEFLGETEAKVSGLTLEQDLPGTTFELGGGFDIALPQDGVSFTVDADYTFGDEAEGVSATGGFRINW